MVEGQLELKLALRVIKEFQYNSFADVGYWYFTNGMQATMHCNSGAGRILPPGTKVYCVFEKFGDGYRLKSLREVTGLAPEGLPILSGPIIEDGPPRGWNAPMPGDKILDERQSLDRKVLGAAQINMPKELPKIPDPRQEE